MSLTRQQKADTIEQFQRAMNLLGLTPALVAHDLHTTEQRINQIAHLRCAALEEPWILRNYLLRKVEEAGIGSVAFTALAGDYHTYWFLDGNVIDHGTLG